MTTMKRTMAIFICTVLFAAMIPAINISAAEIIADGTCGDNLTWTLDDDGALTISGTGDMWDCSDAPWDSYKASIKSVIIEDGATSIGNYAFNWCEALTNVTIPDSVKVIGDYAFNYCYSLTSITIPDSVESIGERAFYLCYGLTSAVIGGGVKIIGYKAFSMSLETGNVTLKDGVETIGDYAFSECGITSIDIPNSVITIGEGAFYECFDLTSITIPSGVTNIGEGAFCYCAGLTEINVDENNEVYASSDGILFSKDMSELVIYPCGKSALEYSVPSGVTSIADYAFSYFESLTNITIPKSVTSIGDSAFHAFKALSDVYYEGSEADWANVSIGDYNDYLTNATIHYNSTMPTAAQSDNITVTLNGNAIEFDQPPVIINGRTLVPLRAIFEALGASVEWDGETQTATAEKDTTSVIMTVGETQMYVNGEAKELDTAPQLINNRTLVPARAIAEAFGCNVDWDNETRTVVITQ